jgi:hypothetical protein
MKKFIIIFLAIICISAPRTYAAYGNAKDGELFAISLIGFLLLVAGILFLIDFLQKNGKKLIQKLLHHFRTPQKQDIVKPAQPIIDEPDKYLNYSC